MKKLLCGLLAIGSVSVFASVGDVPSSSTPVVADGVAHQSANMYAIMVNKTALNLGATSTMDGFWDNKGWCDGHNSRDGDHIDGHSIFIRCAGSTMHIGETEMDVTYYLDQSKLEFYNGITIHKEAIGFTSFENTNGFRHTMYNFTGATSSFNHSSEDDFVIINTLKDRAPGLYTATQQCYRLDFNSFKDYRVLKDENFLEQLAKTHKNLCPDENGGVRTTNL